jgi:hypothetical protein
MPVTREGCLWLKATGGYVWNGWVLGDVKVARLGHSAPGTHTDLLYERCTPNLGRMPRRKIRHRKNFNDPGDAHELTWSCYHRYQFLRAERTCEWLKEATDEARVEQDFAL